MNNYEDIAYQNFYNVNDLTNLPMEKSLQQELVSPEVALRRGNMFNNLYWPYTKEAFTFVPKNDREKLLLEIMQNSFYAHELNLYLDTHPEDVSKITMFKKYNEISNNLINEYEKKYAPLTLSNNNLEGSPWTWVTSPWPWEGV